MTTTLGELREVDREAMQRWLPTLGEWLLPGAFYGVHHTWPQLYRRDGHGRFFVLADGDRLLSHCAFRTVTMHGEHGPFRANLLGSVATDPTLRGRGLASDVLGMALAASAGDAPVTLLWAERPELYARAGFALGAEETCLVLARRPRPSLDGVRPMTIADHAACAHLHAQKPLRVERDAIAMSGLLTTPGMTSLVLERNGAVVAYALCGKGADLQGHWHELGGSDEDLAILLPAALHVAEQRDAVLLLPPYRAHLRALLGASVVGDGTLHGPMWRSLGEPLPPCFVDGIDSV